MWIGVHKRTGASRGKSLSALCLAVLPGKSSRDCAGRSFLVGSLPRAGGGGDGVGLREGGRRIRNASCSGPSIHGTEGTFLICVVSRISNMTRCFFF